MTTPPSPAPILLFDGVCGLCNRLVQFVLARDHKDRFRFASLQSGFGRDILTRHGKDPDRLDTFYMVLEHGTPREHLVDRARAALRLFKELGGLWSLLSVLGVLPTPLLNAGYNLIAGNRYRLFGTVDACQLPEPRHRKKFIEV